MKLSRLSAPIVEWMTPGSHVFRDHEHLAAREARDRLERLARELERILQGELASCSA